MPSDSTPTSPPPPWLFPSFPCHPSLKFALFMKNTKFTVTEKIVYGCVVTDFPFINLNSLDYALNELDEENQSDVPTAQCAPAYKPLYNILMKFFRNLIL